MKNDSANYYYYLPKFICEKTKFWIDEENPRNHMEFRQLETLSHTHYESIYEGRQPSEKSHSPAGLKVNYKLFKGHA